MTDTVYHMVHYREFSHSDAGQAEKDFESLMRERLDETGQSGFPRWESIEDRVFDIGDGTGMELVLNRVADLSSAVFGEMCLVHRDGVQALLQLTASKHQLSSLTMAEIYSLTEQGAPFGSRYVRGLAYFLAIGQHLFFIRTQSLTPKNIELYFEWLLKTSPTGLSNNSSVDFASKFDKSVLGDDIGEVKALRVSGPSFPQMAITPTSDKETKERATTRKIADKIIEFGQAFDLASTLLGPAKAKALAESLGPKERLVVDASVRVKGSRTQESKNKMAELARELDGITDGKITVEGKDGKITDQDVILRTSMPFEFQDGGKMLLDFDRVADQLQVVYQRFVDDGKISA